MRNELDVRETGEETLKRMQSVDKYNDWIYRELSPLVGECVLEVGCGIGNMTRYFVENRTMVSIDCNPSAVQAVKGVFSENAGFRAYQGDVCDESMVERLNGHRFDTVLCINVLEHIEDDAAALRNMWRLLEPSGRLLLFVPAGQYMYGSLDEALGHFRRYDHGSLRQLLVEQGFTLEKMDYMNVAGIFGWYLNSKILRRQVLPTKMLRLFNLLAPLFIALEAAVKPPFGQSLLSVARKPHV